MLNYWQDCAEENDPSKKMPENSSSAPKRASASGDPLELVSAICGPNSDPIFFGLLEYLAQND
jgi:hypothetical protein